MSFSKKEIKKKIGSLMEEIGIVMKSLGFLMIIVIVGTFVVIGAYFQFTGGSANKYVDRALLISKIKLSISNGAELEDIVQIFENRKHVRRPFFNVFFEEKENSFDDYYEERISMQKVLRDLKAELFLKKNVNQELAKMVKDKLNEHKRTDPFDKLELGQKIHFEVVQTKLADKYSDIQININRIVDELDNKNKLVAKYLTDATLSLRIAMIALIIGLFALVPQMIRGWKSWRKKSVESVK